MELIDCYQPEFVTRYTTIGCECPACQKASGEWPRTRVILKNQLRESLVLACESAAAAILLDPEAFNLHATRCEPAGGEVLSLWHETLNQQCINLAVHPALSLHVSLYAIGVLLSKAQRYWENGEHDPMLLHVMGEQLALLAEEGILDEQFAELPPIMPNRTAALRAMGSIRLNLNLPMAEKMSIVLRLSELAIMTPERLEERLIELENSWGQLTLFNEQPHILRNFLIYQLYHHIFPGISGQNYGQAFLELATTLFRIRILCAMALDNSAELNPEQIVIFISALTQWELQATEDIDKGPTADYSLLGGLSLI